MKIYIAGPLFTSAERLWNWKLAKLLRDAGLYVFLPQEIEAKHTGRAAAEEIFQLDIAGIDTSDAVVAIMDQPDPDSGTCWEMGYAYAKNKIILAIRTDFRTSGGESKCIPYNIMPYMSAQGTREIPFTTVEETAEIIIDWFKGRGDL